MPFSLREAPDTFEDVRMNNNFVAVPTNIRLFGDFGKALMHFQKQFKIMRTSLGPFGVFSAFHVVTLLPYMFPRLAIFLISSKYTMIYSNLNASKTPWVFDGKKSVGAFFYVTSPGKIGMGASICTSGGVCMISINGDEAALENQE
jgi:hypothetical protein